MKRSVLFFMLVLLAMVVFAGCGGDDSSADGDNPDGDNPDGDDPDGDDPDGDGPDGDSDGDDPDGDSDGDDSDGDVPCEEDTPCKTNEDCCDGFACHDELFLCKEAECNTTADCATYGANFECDPVDALCYPIVCTENGDCPTGFVCLAGGCEQAPSCDNATSIQINQGNGLIRQGETLTLSATVFNANGAKLELVGDSLFSWGSSLPAAVAVGASDGVLTGGDTAGSSTITATLTCKTAVNTTVTYQNFPTVTAGDARVVVFNDKTGELLSGAKVFLDGTAVDTVDGVANFASTDCSGGCDMHVFHADYTYVSAMGLTVQDMIVPLSANGDNTVAAGVLGAQDPSPIPEAVVGNNDVRLGFTSFSIPGNLADLNFEALIGTMKETHVQIGTVLDDNIPLPGGLEGYLMDDPIKEGFSAEAVAGKATLWGLGGYAKLADLIQIVTQNLGDEIDVAAILGAILPLFESFYHGIVPGFDLQAIAKVADADDLNGDGNTDDLVPDYANFTDIGSDMKLNQSQTQRTELTFANLPDYGDSCADSVIVLAGANQSGIGFVPLGLTAGLDKRTGTDTADCKVGEDNDGKIMVPFAPQHSGLSGYEYYFLGIALSLDSLLGDISLKEEMSIDLSGVLAKSSSSPESVTMPAFVDFMSDADYTYTAATKNLAVTATALSDDVSFHRIVIRNDTDDATKVKFWHIYWPNDEGGFDFDQPAEVTDNRGVNISSASLVQGIKLDGVSYDDLFEFNGINTTMMNDYTSAFSMHAVDD